MGEMEQLENHKDERVSLARRGNFVGLFQGTKNFVQHFCDLFWSTCGKNDRRAKIPSGQNFLDHLRTNKTPKIQHRLIKQP